MKGYRALGWKAINAKHDHGVHAPRRLTPEQLWQEYLELWRQWARENPALIEELRKKSAGLVLTDRFARTPISQARALAEILNETENSK